MEYFNQILKKQCDRKNNSLCIGLDVDNKKLENTSIEYMKSYIFDIIDANACVISEPIQGLFGVLNNCIFIKLIQDL